jgi:hypothetical protein
MFASGISSSAQQNIASFQAQQQQRAQQQFQTLAQQFQSSGLSSAQTTALSDQSLPANATATAQAGASQTGVSQTGDSQSCGHSGASHFHHRLHIPVDPGSSSTSNQALDDLGSELPSASPSTAQQAYSSLGQNLPQAPEIGTQSSGVSLTF